MIKLSAIQLSSTANVATNLAKIAELLAKITATPTAVYNGSGSIAKPEDVIKEPIQHLVVLPECCLYFGGKDSEQLTLAKTSAAANELRLALGRLAQQFKVYLVAGTVPILTTSATKFTNSSCVFSPSGDLLGQYDKMHLFDVNVSDNTKSYCESHYTQAGKELIVVNTVFANIGLSVCFDLRFPNLFQRLTQAGAEIITVPSAFTKVTGKAHWQILLQARAIENQVYIIAAGQEGVHENGRETWGHSMIINPWGEIEQSLATGEGFITVEYQKKSVTGIRQNMPLNSPLNN
ncbi:amidohydrolase [Colwellia sp. MT41]|uniref:Amidohydrolase n=1 Tax=Colwellia marinimaniae TaxID=1513592 RepID=A0ABQ0MQ16_9GAMM|nr:MULTISPECIES: carbon-nitrogen hydrolase family protein [Colwellia]ALO36052.1 amidohydrolase [Colwellia sp. MT41]GAW94433.1 amidohydrolase [Colwellia marinimaniae]